MLAMLINYRTDGVDSIKGSLEAKGYIPAKMYSFEKPPASGEYEVFKRNGYWATRDGLRLYDWAIYKNRAYYLVFMDGFEHTIGNPIVPWSVTSDALSWILDTEGATVPTASAKFGITQAGIWNAAKARGLELPRSPLTRKRTASTSKTKEAVKWLQDNPGVTIQEAASKFGVHAGSIRNDASQRGVSLVRSGRMGKTARAVEMMMDNKSMTISEATRECCVTSSSIYTFARERGIDLTRVRESVGNEDLAVDWLLCTPNSTIQQAADKFHLKESVVRYHCQRLGVRLFTTSVWVKSRHD